jgi:hypothetical protein
MESRLIVDKTEAEGRPPAFGVERERSATVRNDTDSIQIALDQLESYCRARDWAGYDPYDALNSKRFARTPLAKSSIARLALTQTLKRSPLDFRRLLAIPPQQDPKATALFLMTYVRRARKGDATSRETAKMLADRLLTLRSPSMSYWCWGYSFPWQTRKALVPRFSPNLVTTTFAANALLDAYEIGLGDKYLNAGVSAGDYIAQQLYWNDGTRAAFAYPRPDVRVPVHNANFLGAALLCRLSKLTGATSGIDVALAVARYSADSQREDGSWAYGLASTQQWIDNFHTGYNLCALDSIASSLGTGEFESAIRKGFAFYRERFFTDSGAPKYFHDRTFPIDIHCVAQSIITLIALRELDPRVDATTHSVLAWAMRHMWSQRGFFYYRKLRSCTIRISYMRWSQAWMLYALTVMRDHQNSN